jgi:nucleotide-binding universal stress UspA family protein
MRLLIAYDGSTSARVALDNLSRSGLGAEVTATVLSAADVWLEPPPFILVRGFDEEMPARGEQARRQASGALSEARVTADQGARRLRKLFPRWEVECQARAGTPAWEIVQAAAEVRADLIVVGSHGRSGIGQFVLGSVSHAVVEHASCSVHVSRGYNHRLASPPVIVVGIDGSEDADGALRVVEQRAWMEGTSVEVVGALDPVLLSAFGHMIPPLVGWGDAALPPDRDLAEAASAGLEAVVEARAERLRRRGLDAHARVVRGAPTGALLQVAHTTGADCIFLGARGLRRVARFLLGSVSAGVAGRAQCSVEVVRQGPLRMADER